MLSVASVRSASGAAGYFATDNYYTAEESAETSAWGGEGAKALGLEGPVAKEQFEAILNGQIVEDQTPSEGVKPIVTARITPMPDALKGGANTAKEGPKSANVNQDGKTITQVGNPEKRRYGMDLTFSMPKSASVLAYVGDDKRILVAHLAAVRETMGWVEKTLAQGRAWINDKDVPVNTGNLTYALFQHDTSRALDPQGHIHVVIANMTQMPDGSWKALHNDKLWSNNTVIGSIYHAHFRDKVQALGYQTALNGKHGAFEISGVPEPVLKAFSQRRAEILAKGAEINATSPKALSAITKNTRDPKRNIEDRETLKAEWVERSAALGYDVTATVAEAKMVVALSGTQSVIEGASAAISGAVRALGGFIKSTDPLLDKGLARMLMSAERARAQVGVASAIRILSEREAAFSPEQLLKTALDLGLSTVTAAPIEKRILELVGRGELVRGRNNDLTTKAALATENGILREVRDGQGAATPLIPADQAPARLQAVAGERPLNAEQLAAASMILSSDDRIVAVQGVAGGGKSTLLSTVAKILDTEGKTTTGLAFTNKIKSALKEDSGIESQTIHSFILANQYYLDGARGRGFDEKKALLKGSYLILDEASQVSNTQTHDLVKLANLFEVERLVLVGDRQQLASIDAGKSFIVLQEGGTRTARVDINLRQQTEQLKTVAALANVGEVRQALVALGEKVIEAPQDPVAHAAALYMALNPNERSRTELFTSGREARRDLNLLLQDGLKSEGQLRGTGILLDVRESHNLAREAFRYQHHYVPGATLIAQRDIAELRLPKGEYKIEQLLDTGKVDVSSSTRRVRFDPSRLKTEGRMNALSMEDRHKVRFFEGDKIRWTANDKTRGIDNSTVARIVGIDGEGVKIQQADMNVITLKSDDPMLGKLDLGYALNMHQAQGMTTDKAIVVMLSHERNLTNQQLFNVAVTRVKWDVQLVTDDKTKLGDQLRRNSGEKSSALQTTGALQISKPDVSIGFDPDKPKGMAVSINFDRKAFEVDFGAVGPSSANVRPVFATPSAPILPIGRVPEATKGPDKSKGLEL